MTALNEELAKIRVLLIDDDKEFLMIFKHKLAKLGVGFIAEAMDSRSALEKIRSGDYDLIFCDWQMPDVSGLELLRGVREFSPKVPFIMVTAEAKKEKVTEVIKAGVTDYLRKPFTSESLLEKVTTMMEKIKAYRAAVHKDMI
jgi:two-component system, chemotaxis family, chemotaxis protein CheY